MIELNKYPYAGTPFFKLQVLETVGIGVPRLIMIFII
jgi:hypothetical protein